MSKNLPKVRALIHKACPQWYDLGLELGVEEATLNIIKSDSSNKTETCFREMLSTWLKMIDPQPSWEGLIAALKRPYIGHAKLADEVRKEQGIPIEADTLEAGAISEDQKTLSPSKSNGHNSCIV